MGRLFERLHARAELLERLTSGPAEHECREAAALGLPGERMRSDALRDKGRHERDHDDAPVAPHALEHVVRHVVDLDGADHPKVVSYADILSGAVVPGKRVAVIGAGGIGVDVSHLLTHDPADGRPAKPASAATIK